jgi:uncharacterized protein YdeI (YjbR/CyaY-like superfamily)
LSRETKLNVMPVIEKRVDAYIEKAAPFAKPILKQLRKVVQTACPDMVETIKWSFPNFDYKGSILCSMAAFKQHCAFGFWLGALMKDPDGILDAAGERTAMGHLGQIKSVDDLPSDKILTKYIHQAMELIDKGTKLPKKPSPAIDKTVIVPEYFLTALQANKEAQKRFEAFPYSHKKEYVMWITEAKTEATRQKRIATAIEWIAEGKGRNWKYE